MAMIFRRRVSNRTNCQRGNATAGANRKAGAMPHACDRIQLERQARPAKRTVKRAAKPTARQTAKRGRK